MIGRDAKQTIDDALSNSENPAEYCAQFREAYSIRKGRVQPMVELLELCGRSTKEINSYVLERVRRRMIDLVAKASPEQLRKLHFMTFPYLAVPELRAITFAVLERVKDIDEEDLRDLAPALGGTLESPLKQEPYAKLPGSVKQKIWRVVPAVFKEELATILQEVAQPKKNLSMEELTLFVAEEDRKAERRRSVVLCKLLRLMEDSSGQIDPGFLSLTASAILELCEDQTKVGTRARLTSYVDLYADLLLEVQDRVEFSSSNDFPTLQLSMKAVQVLNAGYVSGRLTSKIFFEFTSLAVCCTKGKQGFVHIVLLLCSSMARDIIPKMIVDRLREVAVKRSGNLRGFQDNVLEQLSILAWSAIQVERVLEERIPYPMGEQEKELLFGLFYVLLGQNIYEDHLWNSQLAIRSDRNPVDDRLFQYLRRGSLQRRILAAYGVEMYRAQDILGLSRFRRHFDILAESAEQLLEDREKAIGKNLILQIEME